MIWEKTKTVIAILVLSALANVAALWLQSDFLDAYLCGNIVIILITLLAINITTTGVIMTKLKEIADAFGGNFAKTVDELELSIQEQVILLTLSVLCLTLKSSQIIRAVIPHNDLIFSTLISGIFIYAVHILYDTGKSVFVILRFEQNKPKP